MKDGTKSEEGLKLYEVEADREKSVTLKASSRIRRSGRCVKTSERWRGRQCGNV